MKPRRLAILVGLALALAFSVGLAASVGTARLSMERTWRILLHGAGIGAADWPAWQQTVLLEVRLPRVLVAALAGGALAAAGAVMQAIFRNPMAEPGLLGVSQGAALGSILALYTGLALASPVWLPALAFVFAVGCAFLVYAIASRHGRTPVTTLLLSGIALGGVASALAAFVLSVSLDNFEIGRQMIAWLLGGLEGRTWVHFRISAPIIVGGTIWMMLYARELNILITGEETALSLGVDVPRVRRNLIVLASLVTAASVSVTGVVGFVGLMVPHIVRVLVGPDHRVLLPASFLGGAAFLVLADLLCRTALPFEEIRLGVVTGMIGGVFFLYLLVRGRRRLETL